MLPILLRLTAIGIGGYLLSEIFSSDEEFEITKASNCDSEFKTFNYRIEISNEKKEKLKRAHNTIRTKVKNYINFNTNLPLPSFFIQGSYKTKTLVENTIEKCDVDLGIFFPCNPKYQIETIQNYIKNALSNHTTKGVIIKENCVRLNYVKDFHIDLPIYYFDNGETYFGSRGYEWELSDPKGFVKWFNEVTYKKPQLIRIIRYLKAWLQNVKTSNKAKVPSGLTLTLWAIEFYVEDDRDDLSFFQTSIGILQHLNDESENSWNAIMPVEPNDDVFDRINMNQKNFFYEELRSMIELAKIALSSDKNNGLINWGEIFGSKF